MCRLASVIEVVNYPVARPITFCADRFHVRAELLSERLVMFSIRDILASRNPHS